MIHHYIKVCDILKSRLTTSYDIICLVLFSIIDKLRILNSFVAPLFFFFFSFFFGRMSIPLPNSWILCHNWILCSRTISYDHVMLWSRMTSRYWATYRSWWELMTRREGEELVILGSFFVQSSHVVERERGMYFDGFFWVKLA